MGSSVFSTPMAAAPSRLAIFELEMLLKRGLHGILPAAAWISKSVDDLSMIGSLHIDISLLRSNVS